MARREALLTLFSGPFKKLLTTRKRLTIKGLDRKSLCCGSDSILFKSDLSPFRRGAQARRL
jgi:hypothetical protein